MTETAERTKRIIADYLEMDAAQLSGEALFADDLEMDSLAKMELIIALEEEFSIEVNDETLDQIMTVQDAIDVIETARVDILPATS